MTRRMRLAVALWPWVLAVVILGPALLPGYVLSYDMVFVPDLALRSDFLGLGSALPRAVPSDAVIAVLDEVVPGMLLQKLILLASIVLAGMGARRLVAEDNGVAQLAATSLYVWNPYVAERLGIGHWPLLLTYAVLPWIFHFARADRGAARPVAVLVLLVAVGSLSAAGGVISSFFAVACAWLASGRSARRVTLVALGAIAVNAPWLVTGVLHGEAALSDPAGITAFASRGEGPLPVVASVLTLGGIWNAEVVPATRMAWPALMSLLLVVGVCAAGMRSWSRSYPVAERCVLLLAGVVGLSAALAGSLAPTAMEWVVATVPGGGLLRDGARFLALLAPLEASLFGFGVSRLASNLRPAPFGVAIGTVLVLSPVVVMPDLAMGGAARLEAVDFPEEYERVRGALGARVGSAREGDLLLLPFSSYRLPGWNDDRPTLDPLGRYMTPDYLTSDTLFVSGRRVAGEDRRARRVERILTDVKDPESLSRALRGEGIAWVLLDREAESEVGTRAPSARPADRELLWSGESLLLWELSGPVEESRAPVPVTGVVAAWVIAGGTVVGCGAALALARSRGKPLGMRANR